MLSNLVLTPQRFVLVIDELGTERVAHKFCCQLLREQGQKSTHIKRLYVSSALKDEHHLQKFFAECAVPPDTAGDSGDGGTKAEKWNVLLPTYADLLSYQRPSVIFQFLHKLRKCPTVQRIILWASTQHLPQPAVYLVAACEYMADLVLHLQTKQELSIVTRKAGGGVTNKRYSYQVQRDQFTVEPIKQQDRLTPPGQNNTETMQQEALATFKIDLDEEELVARNSLKLPYEKTTEINAGGNIIYTPDATDDYDDEDPDEDLCI